MKPFTQKPAPYYSRNGIEIYHSDCRAIEPGAIQGDVVMLDPPFGSTSLAWDRAIPRVMSIASGLATAAGTLWLFCSVKVLLGLGEMADWAHVQEVVWKKQNGTNMHNDRFRRVHELVVQFRRAGVPFRSCFKQPQFTLDARRLTMRRKAKPPHMRAIAGHTYLCVDGGPRLTTSVIEAHNCHGYAVHPTQKPVDLIALLLGYSCPPGGLVVDPCMGSGSVLVAARQMGRRAIGIETSKKYCDAAVQRLEDLEQKLAAGEPAEESGRKPASQRGPTPPSTIPKG